MIEYIQKMGRNTIDQGFYARIAAWEAWYRGTVDSFHRYSQYNGIKTIARERATLGMAKRVCEDWANLLLNERVDMRAGGSDTTCRLHEILNANNFRVRANQLIELTFALGTGAFVAYKQNRAVRIDYIRAGMIFPLSWDNGNITECAFASEMVSQGKAVVYVQAHTLEHGKYVIQNRMFDKATGGEVPLPEHLAPLFATQSEAPLFHIIRPNVVNHVDFDNPMGVSVFAGSVDVLKGLDLVFDSLHNEFRLGKKRIVVPATMAQIMHGETGMKPIFDTNDTEFFALPVGADGGMDLKEINMNLRIGEHAQGLTRLLGLLSDKCGLGSDRYRFEAAGIKTATQVISEKSELFQNLRKHELLLRNALCNLAKSVLLLDGCKEEVAVEVAFDDGIISDRQADFAERLQLLQAGVMQPYELRMWYWNEGEPQAKAMVEQSHGE